MSCDNSGIGLVLAELGLTSKYGKARVAAASDQSSRAQAWALHPPRTARAMVARSRSASVKV